MSYQGNKTWRKGRAPLLLEGNHNLKLTLKFKLDLTMIRCREGNGTPLSSTLAWKIPWKEEPGGLQSMGSLRVRHG